MSDLTSLVQVGDLLVRGGEGGSLAIVEVKEGEMNERILAFSQSIREVQCPYALQSFRDAHGEKAFEQLKRVNSQKARAEAIANLLNEERGLDPNLKLPIRIQQVPIPITTYDANLSHAVEESNKRGWAIDVIDDCIFLGAYRGEMRRGSHVIFKGWFDASGSTTDSPVIELRRSLAEPLALPPFARGISRDKSLDVIFGRCVVHVGVHVPKLIDIIRKTGVSVRSATRKEAAQFKVSAGDPILLEGRPVLLDYGGATTILYDGILFRMLFHGLTPSAAAIMVATPPERSEDDLSSSPNK
jgi:hypothetical protein